MIKLLGRMIESAFGIEDATSPNTPLPAPQSGDFTVDIELSSMGTVTVLGTLSQVIAELETAFTHHLPMVTFLEVSNRYDFLETKTRVIMTEHIVSVGNQQILDEELDVG